MWKNDVIIKLKKTIELIEFEFINIFSRFLCVSLFTVWQWLVSRLSSQLLAAEQPHTDTVHRVLLYMCVHSAIGRPSLHSLASPCVRWMYTPTPNQTCAWFTNTCSWSNEQHLRSIYCTAIRTHTRFSHIQPNTALQHSEYLAFEERTHTRFPKAPQEISLGSYTHSKFLIWILKCSEVINWSAVFVQMQCIKCAQYD